MIVTTDPSVVFAALADATRRRLFERVEAADGITASALADGAAVSRQAIVKHLQVLAEAGLIDADRCGREVRFRVIASGWKPAVAWISEREANWNRRLQRLERNVAARQLSRRDD